MLTRRDIDDGSETVSQTRGRATIQVGNDSGVLPGAEYIDFVRPLRHGNSTPSEQHPAIDDDGTIVIGDGDLTEAQLIDQSETVRGVYVSQDQVFEEERLLNLKRKHRLLRMLGLVAIAIFIVIAVTLGVHFGTRTPDDGKIIDSLGDSDDLLAPTGSALPAPAPNASSGLSSPAPTLVVSTFQPSFSEDRIRNIIESLSPATAISFDNPFSPQTQALEWLLADAYSSFGISDDRVIQRFALATLWFSLTDQSFGEHDTGWLRDRNECTWRHQDGDSDFFCDSSNQVVKELHLKFRKLSGRLPEEIGLLSHMTRVILNTNSLVGSIPTQIGKLSELTELYLSANNDMESEIPSELGKLTKLLLLDLSNMSLVGRIPSELGLMVRLTSLVMSTNDLTGTIPSNLCRLTDLRTLSVSINGLTGTIPSEIGQLTKLKSINVEENSLTGYIPSQIGLLTDVLQVHLKGNHLSGSIPSSLCSAGVTPEIDCSEILCQCCSEGASLSPCILP